jgi:hypothetical protein
LQITCRHSANEKNFHAYALECLLSQASTKFRLTHLGATTLKVRTLKSRKDLGSRPSLYIKTWGFFSPLLFLPFMRVIRKVRKTQPQNPEFGHTQGETQKTPTKKYIKISMGGETQKTINFGGKLSFILSFLFPERLHCCYIYFHCS